MADGWSGMEALYDFKKRSIRELRAYMQEIREADNLGLSDVSKQLWEKYLAERKYIIDNYGPLPQY